MGTLLITILIAAGAVLAGALLYWYAFRFEPSNFKLSEVAINFKNTNQELDSYPRPQTSKTILKILHLTDFHLRKDRNGKKLFNFIKSLKSLKPDLILLTGDLVEKDAYFDYLTEMLSGLNAGLGKFAVFGVHDYYHKRPTEFIKNMIKRQKIYQRENSIDVLIEKLNGIGIKALRNEKVSLDFDAESSCNSIKKIDIVGVDDAVIKRADVCVAFKQNNAAQFDAGSKYPENPGLQSGRNRESYGEVLSVNKENVHNMRDKDRIVICITHTPDMDIFADLVKSNTDLVISGHTHGGQVRLPGIGAIITGANIPVKYASGLFYFKKFVLYVSRGLGQGKYSPFRFYCQPEATLINIKLLF